MIGLCEQGLATSFQLGATLSLILLTATSLSASPLPMMLTVACLRRRPFVNGKAGSGLSGSGLSQVPYADAAALELELLHNKRRVPRRSFEALYPLLFSSDP